MGKIYFNGEEYGGSEVVANPSGSASAALTKLKVDNTIYSISGGGGSNTTPYLKSSGSQYIDTGIKPDEDTSIVCDFFIDIEQLNKASSWQTIFAGNDGNTVNSLQFSFNPSASKLTYQDGSAYSDVDGRFITPIDIHRASVVKGVCTFDKLTMFNWTIGTFTGGHNIYLFAGNTNGTAEGLASICLLGCKIYSGNTLVADFVPVNNNGVACLYDNVSQTYFTNQGTGSFTYGEL